MIALGLLLALLSGLANGLFTTPMKLIPHWRWENIWLVFILLSCLILPPTMVLAASTDLFAVLQAAPRPAVASALAFGFFWGFGAILFGLSVDRLGVSLANSMVIGVSSSLGSLVPLILTGALQLGLKQLVLLAGVSTFLAGVRLCGTAGRRRDTASAPPTSSPSGYWFAVTAGVLSAVFNIGYSLSLPLAEAAQRLGLTRFQATNCIWLLMLAPGAIPNVVFCTHLLRKNSSAGLFLYPRPERTWGFSLLMGLLWAGSIFLYGAATPLLGRIGLSIAWPLSLAVSLLVANLMGVLLGEWRHASREAVTRMRMGILVLLAAIVLCALAGAL